MKNNSDAQNQLINQILHKGVSEVIVKKDLEQKLYSGKKLRIKFGIDPSGANLHLGHMIPLRKLGEFQKAGHHIIIIFGNFTGQIGDPTGKTNIRLPKTQTEIEKNAQHYMEQAKFALDITKVEQLWNADWLSPLNFNDIIQLASHFTVAQMLERDMFQKRIEQDLPISLQEFFYPLMQGYDSVHLKCDVEIGGTDQTFNLLVGRTLQKAYGQPPQNILTMPLLIGTDGKKKMGKSENNYIIIHDTPQDMFGKIMSIPDNLIISYFELCTNLNFDEIKIIKKELKSGTNPRDLKIRLAKEIVNMYHNKSAANQAEANFIAVFQKGSLPKNIKTLSLKTKSILIMDLLVQLKFVNSKSEARRLIEGGAVKYNKQKILNPFEEIKLNSQEILLQTGKRHFIYIKY